MAIAETEPKKNEGGGSSTGSRQSANKLDPPKTLASNRTNQSVNTLDLVESSGKSHRNYGLYRISGFHFNMPEDWNDHDIGVFLDSCWENIDMLRNESIDESSKWQAIAEGGEMKSHNPSLFTVNGCLEISRCIRQYVTSNKDKLSNDSFNKFYEDVLDLIPYFSPCPIEKKNVRSNDKVLDLKEYLHIFRENENSKKLEKILFEYLPQIETATMGVWNEVAMAVGDSTGHYLNIKAFFELAKKQVILKGDEHGVKKVDVYNQIDPYFKLVFDYVIPKTVKASDFLLATDSTDDSDEKSDGDDTDEGVPDRNVSKENSAPDSSDNVATSTQSFSQEETSAESSQGEPSVEPSPESSQEPSTTFPAKRKKGRPPKKALRNEGIKTIQDVRQNTPVRSGSLEPTSTTLLDEGVPSIGSTRRQYGAKEMDIDGTVDMEEKNFAGFSEEPLPTGLRKRRERLPTRILPSREAKSKPICPLPSKRIKSQITLRNTSNYSQTFDPEKLECNRDRDSAKMSPNFRGFEDTDSDLASEEETSRKLSFVRKVTTTQRTVTQRLPNPDTTTNELDNPVQNSRNDDMSSYVRRLTRQAKESLIKGKYVTEEKVENKVMTGYYVRANSTLNPVVKLRALKKSELGGDLSSTYVRNIDVKGMTLSAVAPKPNIPVESAVLGRDVVKSVYNPNSDTAKTHAGPGSPINRHRVAIGTSRGNHPSTSNSRRGIKDHKIHYNYYSDSDESEKSEERNSKMERKNLSRTPHSSDKKGPSESFMSTEHSAENSDMWDLSPDVISKVIQNPLSNCSSDSEPSTSSSLAISPELALSVLKSYQQINRQQLSIPSYKSSQKTLDTYQNKPPWLAEIMADFRKGQVWKMQQFVKLHQDLSDLEREKISIMREIKDYICRK